MLTAASNHNGNCSKLARSRFINSGDARPLRPLSWVRPEVASYLNVTFTRFCLAIIAVVTSSGIGTQAQEPTPTATPQIPSQPVATMVEVIVTGSNIPTSEEVGPQPVDTYRRADIERLGARSVTDFVQKLPVATGPSINENANTLGNGQTEIDLRGLAAKETLVLQDGRRLAPDGFAGYYNDLNAFFGGTVDLNLFPFGLIDHIDILKDGASAIYGSDAVGGVFNVWLIHRFRGLEIYASYGNTNLGASNDQGEERAYLLAGTGDDKTDMIVYAEVYNRAAIYKRDRDITSNADFTRFGGFDARSEDFAGRVGDFVYQPLRNRGAGSPTRHAFPDVAHDPQYVLLSSLPRAQQLFNYAALTTAMAPVDREYLYGSLDHKICDQYLELFADFKYVRSFWDGALAPAPPNQPPLPSAPDVFTDAIHPFGISGTSNGISVPIQNPFNPFTVADYTSPGGADLKSPGTQVSDVPPGTPLTTGVRYSAGLRTNKITTHNYEFTGGLNGNLAEFGDYFKTWNWESAFRYNEDQRIQRFGGIVDNNALRAALLDTNPATAFNPFSISQNSPAVINKIFVTTHRLGTASLMLEDLKLYGNLWSLPAGPISFAAGDEHRKETVNDQPDALTASGQTTGSPNSLSTKGSRDVWSIYWEVRVPVTSPAWHCFGLYSLELGYQERYDNYSDFGSTEKPKVFFRWQPIDSSLTLRGTYNEAYHAPTLAELYTSQAQIFVLVNDPAGLTLPPNNVIKETIGGNPDLRPETAYEWTYGAVWTPAKLIKGLTLSADFYHIDLRNVIVDRDANIILFNNWNGSTGTLPNGAPTGGPFSELIQRNPKTGAVLNVNAALQNLSRVITEGLDCEASYQLDTSIFGRGTFGTFTFTVNGNYLARYVLQPSPAARQINFDNRYWGPRLGSFPRNRWYASVFYDLGGLDAGATVHYIGQYWDADFVRKVREWTTLDLIVNYTFNLPASAAQNEVAGYARDGGKNTELKDGKGKNVMPVSTAEYNPCGWRAWLNNTTITLGMNNVFDQDPPFVAGNTENGYDQFTANIQGRTWFVALTKRF
jgi:iron complex outermembrane receptor protein